MPKKLTKEICLERFRSIHGDKYDYEPFNYNNVHDILTVHCKHHGKFIQSITSHLKGSGCSKCVGRYKPDNEEFIEMSKKLHKNKFDYSLVDYKNTKTKINIICPKHGIFSQLPKTHLTGAGCLRCKNENLVLTTEEFIKKSRFIHNEKYDYSKTTYLRQHLKVVIRCMYHGEFTQRAGAHLSGQGCPRCSHIVSKPEILFLDFLGVPNLPENRQKRIGKFVVDGILENSIYEFLGDFYHGNPKTYKSNTINKKNGKSFGELYSKTKHKFKKLYDMGYEVNYIWESDWGSWVKCKNFPIPLKSFKKSHLI
jgi:hypothetical protein